MRCKNQRRAFARTAVLNGSLLFLIGVFAARLPATIAQITGGASGNFVDPINDVYRALMADYVDRPDGDKLRKGAIDGMLEALGDDYAEYIPADEVADFEKAMTGHFVGIGCQVETRDGWLTVVSPLEDSPALAAGIMANDRITKVGETSTFGMTTDACIKMLTGKAGTQVSFTVERDGKEIPFTVTRAPITSHAVRGVNRRTGDPSRWNYLIDPDRRIAYIRLSQFTPDATDELVAALEAARTEHATSGNRDAPSGETDSLGGLILDLRNNPGGVMDAALEIADLFLDQGTIMSIRGRSPLGGGGGGQGGGAEEVFQARGPGTLPDFPLVVLVNEGSASASEIVSGALSDHKRAIVVGTRTFGKGLVQSVSRLPHDPRSQVKFTTQRYYLPSGKLIQRADDSTEWGVDPTPGFFVPLTEREQFESIMRRREWDVLRAAGSAAAPATVASWDDPEWIREKAGDKQLAGALQAIQGRIATGEWTPLSEVEHMSGKIAATELHDLNKARERLELEFVRVEKRISTLEKAAASAGESSEHKMIDLWPDAIDLTGGRVRVFDKDGKEVATLSVTGRDLERWLINADVKPADAESDKPAAAGSAP